MPATFNVQLSGIVAFPQLAIDFANGGATYTEAEQMAWINTTHAVPMTPAVGLEPCTGSVSPDCGPDFNDILTLTHQSISGGPGWIVQLVALGNNVGGSTINWGGPPFWDSDALLIYT